MKRLGGLALIALTLASCAQPLTEIVVVVDSDLSVPAELDSVRVDVTSPDGEFRRASAPLVGERARPLPRTLGIVYRGGPLEPLVVVATGMLSGRDVVQRRAQLAFAPGRVVVLRLDLLRGCVEVACSIDATCTELGCVSSDVDVDTLADWPGHAESRDAAAPSADATDGGDASADACAPAPEECNGRDDDCDGRADEDFDLAADPARCGACDHVCAGGANGSPGCAAGRCALTCDPGWGDCDGVLENGCEALLSLPASCGACTATCSGATPICSGSGTTFSCAAACAAPMTLCGGSCIDLTTSIAHCGGCDRACPPVSGATPTCSGGTCGFSCNAGLYDCNGPVDGCESTLRSPANCGACGVGCSPAHATASCATGTCEIVACEAGWSDCNASVADGCEAAVSSDPAHCGSCAMSCGAVAHAASACNAGACDLVCDPGWADCNRMAADGCEASLSTPATCGSCGIRCDGGTPLCGAAGCISGCAPGETLCSGTCASTQSDPSRCGSCTTVCPAVAHATPTCAAGGCGFACSAGWANCDGMAGNGCEASLSSPSTCGTCTSTCAPAHATPDCATSSCAIASCDASWGDCDGLAGSGCETSLLTTAHCGGCAIACPATAPNATGSSCASGLCVLACAPGWADCDRILSNGCETSLSTLASCGACGAACSRAHATPTCSGATCRIASCDTAFANCDGADANGCERSTATTTDCGACGNACAPTFACISAACRCATGLTSCGGACVDTSSDSRNCGACGRPCDPSASCVSSACVCPSPLFASGSLCVELSRDPVNCGASGRTCRDDQYCVAGSCSCRPGWLDIGGSCADLSSDPSNCGSPGTACPGARPFCAAGACVSSCPGGTDACGGACVVLDSNAAHCGACGNQCGVDEVCVAGSCRGFATAAGCTACPCDARCAALGLATCCTYPGAASDTICVDAASCS